jgi:hypothetical protein
MFVFSGLSLIGAVQMKARLTERAGIATQPGKTGVIKPVFKNTGLRNWQKQIYNSLVVQKQNFLS